MTRRPRRPRHRATTGSDPSPRAGRGAEANADDRDGRRLSRRVQVWVALSSALTNLVGAVIVFAFAVWVLPSDPIPEGDRVVVANAVGVAIWLPVAVAVGTIWGARTMGPARRWLLEERAPTSEEEIAVLRSPLRVFRVQLMLWFVSAVLFSVVNGFVSPRLISRVGFTVVLGGLSTSAVAYLTTERLMRPVAARALAEGDVERPRLPGVAARQLLALGPRQRGARARPRHHRHPRPRRGQGQSRLAIGHHDQSRGGGAERRAVGDDPRRPLGG